MTPGERRAFAAALRVYRCADCNAQGHTERVGEGVLCSACGSYGPVTDGLRHAVELERERRLARGARKFST